MVSKISKDMHIFNAKQFKESVSEPFSSNVYLTIGRVSPWTNDTSPPAPVTSVSSFYDTWKGLIGGKRLVGSDIRHVVPRFNWTAGTEYNQYDHEWDSNDLMSPTNQFYVVTDEFNVYKCLSNNNGGISTSKPRSTTSASHFQTSDKYIWKFMYNLTAEDQQRFLTESYMPVRTLDQNDNSLQWRVQDDAVAGSIHHIQVTNSGMGYTSNNITVRITGDGQFANAYAVRNTISDTIESIVVDNKGSGYTFANISFITGVGNGQAAAKAMISPPGGHGSDPVSELGASYLMIDVVLDGTEDGIITINNDYRQIGFLEDPIRYGTTNVFSNLAFSQLTTVTMSESFATTNYFEDEVVYQGTNLANSTFRATVVSWDFANATLKLSNVQGNPSAALLVGNTSTTSRYIGSVSPPNLQTYSGKMLYIDNVTSISRSEDQAEDFKIVLSF
jgi:hypothetical protein